MPEGSGQAMSALHSWARQYGVRSCVGLDDPGQCMQGSKGSLDNINLFSIITILSFLLLTPFALLRDGGFTFSASAMRGMGILDPNLVIKRALFAGFCFHAYQQVVAGLHGLP